MKLKCLPHSSIALAVCLAGGFLGTTPDATAQTAIPPALRVTGGVDTSKPGALIRTYQVEGFDT